VGHALGQPASQDPLGLRVQAQIAGNGLNHNAAMSRFDDNTRVTPLAPAADSGSAAFTGQVDPAWNIGANPNGGYLLALAAQALRQTTPDQPDPLSISVHYLRPGLAGQACRIDTQLLRSGRTLSTVRATLTQAGRPGLEVLAAMGRLADADSAAAPMISLPMPDLPPPEQCVGRSASAQGVTLSILDQLDIRLHPGEAVPGAAGRARVSGWIRFTDGRPPDALACLLMTDAFPPAVFGLLGLIGWVPTLELTVHLRRKPVAGWLRGLFWSDDLSGGLVVENGALWDASGQLVAQSRQLALVRQDPGQDKAAP
jgi:acyl-CoA thioesterase